MLLDCGRKWVYKRVAIIVEGTVDAADVLYTAIKKQNSTQFVTKYRTLVSLHIRTPSSIVLIKKKKKLKMSAEWYKVCQRDEMRINLYHSNVKEKV